MTSIPKGFAAGARRVRDVVREFVPYSRYSLSNEELRLRVHLRGNKELFEALTALVMTRIKGRANMPVPSDPVLCMASMAMDKELNWFLARLGYVYRSPVSEPAKDSGEQPE